VISHCRIILACALFAFLLSPSDLFAKSKGPTPAGSQVFDGDYISALATANRFLHAWESRDHETGLLLLTDAAKHPVSEDSLHAFLNADPGVREAYEIGRGRKLKSGRYSFPVAIFALPSGTARQWVHPRYSHIIVTRTGKEDWAVDRLP
jgi:hypothetical protein